MDDWIPWTGSHLRTVKSADGDPVEHGVLDPAAVKREATEAATMIARIDDVIASN